MTPFEIGEQFAEPDLDFDDLAAAVYEHQKAASPTYRRFCEGHAWSDWTSVPFLPIEAFKWGGIVDPSRGPIDLTFASSGTGGLRSRHPVRDLKVYERSVTANFAQVFGAGPFEIVAHLPTYRASDEPSSLLYMVDTLISRFGTERSRFADDASIFDTALEAEHDPGAPLIVFGSAFGLLDLVEKSGRHAPAGATIVETGGMKTYRREITREELHERLAAGFGVDRASVRSEYGMCELMSQCYTRGGEVFFPPSWMRFKVVDIDNPELPARDGRPGLLAVFDLANVHSVSAVLTSDLAVERGEGFELLGRADAAEIRGCNFLVQSDP
ncbi:MAG TPA: hypothetical protein VGA18_09730 [Rhodothermales bacterium]